MAWDFYTKEGYRKVQGGSGQSPIAFRGQRTTDVALSSGYNGPLGFDEQFDSDNIYNGVKFQPTKPGYYRLSTMLETSGAASGVSEELYLVKNGTLTTVSAASANVISGDLKAVRSDTFLTLNATALTYMNGSTDYVEVYVWVNSAAATLRGSSTIKTLFEGESISVQGPDGAPGGQATRVTSLPGSPVDGQEILYRFAQTVVPADTQTILWHLKYDAAISKWLPVGAQEPVFGFDATGRAQSFGGAGPSTYTAQPLTATAPLTGKYRVEVGAGGALVSTGTDNLWQLFHDGTSWTIVGSIGAGWASTWSTMNGALARVTLTAGTACTWGCQVGSTTQTINTQDRYLRLFPVQIG